MPQIESDSVIENQEDANEKGNFHIKILEACYIITTYYNTIR